MPTQCNVLGYRIVLYFRGYTRAIEIDENGHSNRNIGDKIKRWKAIEQELRSKFLRTDPNKEDFDIFKTIKEIFRHIKQSPKKTVTNKFQWDYKD